MFPVTFPELGGYEVFIDRVTGLLPPMELKRVYPGGRTTNAPLGLCQFGGAVVVDTVSGDFFSTRPLLWKVRREIDDRIEPILIEKNHDDSGFLSELINTGITI